MTRPISPSWYGRGAPVKGRSVPKHQRSPICEVEVKASASTFAHGDVGPAVSAFIPYCAMAIDSLEAFVANDHTEVDTARKRETTLGPKSPGEADRSLCVSVALVRRNRQRGNRAWRLCITASVGGPPSLAHRRIGIGRAFLSHRLHRLRVRARKHLGT